MSVCLSVCMYVCVCVCVSASVSLYLYPASLYPCIPVSVSLYPCFPVSLYHCITVSVYVSIYTGFDNIGLVPGSQNHQFPDFQTTNPNHHVSTCWFFSYRCSLEMRDDQVSDTGCSAGRSPPSGSDTLNLVSFPWDIIRSFSSIYIEASSNFLDLPPITMGFNTKI